jgi:hypothetical protein
VIEPFCQQYRQPDGARDACKRLHDGIGARYHGVPRRGRRGAIRFDRLGLHKFRQRVAKRLRGRRGRSEPGK